MKFVIEKLSKSSGRLGHVTLSEAGRNFKTPLLLQTTKGGSIPYLSREVFDYVSKEPQWLQMTLATMDQMMESLTLFDGSLASYVGFKDYPTMLFIRDPCEAMPSGGNERDTVPLFTRHGKEALTPERYMEIVESFVPDIYQGLSDADTNFDSSKKRIRKSADRTEKFMNYCYEKQAKSSKLSKSTLFAPIVGGFCTFARSDSIKHARSSSESYGGYVLEGFHNFGLTASALQPTQMNDIVKHCINEMETEKPRVMPGAYNPLTLLTLIRLGVDIFDTSYAYCAAINFKALTFSFDLTQKSAATPFLDLTDDSIKEDFTPFLHSCECLTCRKHTRAYVHHLYKTKELLGPILLMIHNLHHYMRFFETIRRCIESDELAKLAALVENQNTSEAVDYRIEKNTKVIAKTGIGKGFVSAAV